MTDALRSIRERLIETVLRWSFRPTAGETLSRIEAERLAERAIRTNGDPPVVLLDLYREHEKPRPSLSAPEPARLEPKPKKLTKKRRR